MSDTIKVVTTIAMQGALQALEPTLKQMTGKGIALTFGPPSKAVEMVRNGESADVVITTPEGIDELAQAGKVATGAGTVFGKMQMGVGIRAGAAKPDVSTADAFKQTLLSAQSLIHADPASGSPSAAHFIKVANQLGIAETLKPKTVTMSGLVAAAVADGRIELAIQQLAEILLVPGVEAAGPFPMELQNIVPLSAAVHLQSSEKTAAAALIELLTKPQGQAALVKAGLIEV